MLNNPEMTGTKLLTTLVNSLEREGKRYGCLAICEGAGSYPAVYCLLP
jgi:acetyl-CoA acetyltransferase